METKKLLPVHPGKILLHEFIKPLGLTQNELALALHIPSRRVNEIVTGKRSITADMALRLATYFNNSPQFWLGLQMDYELDIAEDKFEQKIKQEIIPRKIAM